MPNESLSRKELDALANRYVNALFEQVQDPAQVEAFRASVYKMIEGMFKMDDTAIDTTQPNVPRKA